jgi:transcriptional regulator with XRE-family HTH domain
LIAVDILIDMSEAFDHHEAPSIPFEDLPARMKRARERTGLHQAHIGAILGIHQRTVANYETGKTEPKIKVLQDWARVTNVPEDWLVLGKEPCTCPSCQEHGGELRSKYSSENTQVSADNVIIADFERIAAGLEERVLSTDGARIYEFPKLPADVEHPLGV